MGSGTQALDQVALDLVQGQIVAIKGLGGFHLACLASDPQAVGRLRERKNRPSKALAVMVADEKTADRLAYLNPADRSWLTGRVRPIVLVPRRAYNKLAENLAPDTQDIGLMLPYTPLHKVLFYKLAAVLDQDLPLALVMTSGNSGHEPIALGNREALARLEHIADLFVFHNRDILVRCDDSVLRILEHQETPLFFRRSRGFVPSPISLAKKGPNVLGLGPELKTTICLTKDDQAFVSQHIGDVQNIATYDFYQQTIGHMQDILQTKPQALITDLHPDFLTTRYAADQNTLPVFSLQHHVAHILAVLAENNCQKPCLGLALDGTGLGLDHTLWGGELLFIDPQTMDFVRLGHFSPIALPGGDKAIAQPWRTAQGLLYSMGETSPADRDWPWIPRFSTASDVVAQMLDKNVNCIQTTSCGRLFDAVSALLGLCLTIDYEGQAAICLEQIQSLAPGPGYECPQEQMANTINLNTVHLFAQVHADWLAGKPATAISRSFHCGLIRGLSRWALAAFKHTGIRRIALSGGVLQNATLAAALPNALRQHGLTPLTHRVLPPNDACISLGQAAYGRVRLRRG
jgi:hydrogenase maturation protein HypF